MGQTGAAHGRGACHLDEHSVRGFALRASAGLSQGKAVRALGGPVAVPIGDAVLDRLLDVTGVCQDRGPRLPEGTLRWPIYRPPLPLEAQNAATDVFETDISPAMH